MTIDEVNQFITTDEGRAWLDGQKKPLLDKRDELLKALKDGNAALSASAQRAADADKLLADERNALSKILIDDTIAAKLKAAGVFEATISTAAATIKELYGLTTKADGLSRTVVGKLDDKEIGLDNVVDHWLHSDMGKANIPASINAGAGAYPRGDARGVPGSLSLGSFEALSAEARMDFIHKGGTIA